MGFSASHTRTTSHASTLKLTSRTWNSQRRRGYRTTYESPYDSRRDPFYGLELNQQTGKVVNTRCTRERD